MAEGSKIDAVKVIPLLANVKDLKSYLGSIQFYNKFLTPNLSTFIEPLNNLTCKDTNK